MKKVSEAGVANGVVVDEEVWASESLEACSTGSHDEETADRRRLSSPDFIAIWN